MIYEFALARPCAAPYPHEQIHASMHRLRHALYRQGAKWTLPELDNMEFDEFDTLAARYLVGIDDTGQVRARRNEMWRWFDTFWMLHIMDYKTRDNFNHPVLIGFAGLALVSALAGFILLILRIQRSLRVQLKAWSKRSTLKGSS